MSKINFQSFSIKDAPTLGSFTGQEEGKSQLKDNKLEDKGETNNKRIKSDFPKEIKSTVYEKVLEESLRYLELRSTAEFVDEILQEYKLSSKSKNPQSIEEIFENNFKKNFQQSLQTDILKSFSKKATSIFEKLFINDDELDNQDNYDLGNKILSEHLHLVDKIVSEIKDRLFKTTSKKLTVNKKR